MKPFRPLLAAAAAAGLLAAGCDYWQNLVGDKVVTPTKLDIRVLDIWTKRPLAEAHCKDAARGHEWTPDREGAIFVASPETGPYVISCTSRFYYNASIEFSLKPEGASMDIHMARLGGADNWYLDDEARQVSIQNAKADGPFTVLRFPSALHMIAGPEDALGRFRYIWKFAKATRLNREANSVYADSTHYRNNAAPPYVEDGLEDTLTLIVKSRFNGNDKEYVVDSVKRTFTWVKNKPPVLQLLPMRDAPYRVGCKEPLNDVMRVNFAASDTDGGRCVSVRFRGANRNSSLRAVDTVVGCEDKSINFYPTDTFTSLSFDSIQTMDDRLLVTVTDDDGGQYDTAIDFKTKANLQPKITAKAEYPGIGFTGEKVRLVYVVEDKDGPVQNVTVNWAGVDGQTEVNYTEIGEGLNRVTDTVSWIYDTPGVKTVSVFTRDYCGDDAVPVTNIFTIRDDRKPTVNLEHVRGPSSDTGMHTFMVRASDKDVNEGLNDAITRIYVQWGDNTFADLDSLYIKKPYDDEIQHRFATPPTSADGRYRIIIDVTDAHHGTSKDTLFFPD